MHVFSGNSVEIGTLSLRFFDSTNKVFLFLLVQQMTICDGLLVASIIFFVLALAFVCHHAIIHEHYKGFSRWFQCDDICTPVLHNRCSHEFFVVLFIITALALYLASQYEALAVAYCRLLFRSLRALQFNGLCVKIGLRKYIGALLLCESD